MPIFCVFKQGWVSQGSVCTAYKRVSAITRDVTSYLNREWHAGLILPISRYQ